MRKTYREQHIFCLNQKREAWPPFFISLLRLIHKWIAVIDRRNKCFLNGSGASPTPEIEDTPSLVIGARASGPTKGLLTNSRTGWFVIYIEVSCGMNQTLCGAIDGMTVLRENGSG
jgi:hypothetical protein